MGPVTEPADPTGFGYPIHLDVRGMIAVVVGLGAVGQRKAVGLLAAGATVRGIDPRGADWASATGIDLRAELYRPEHLTGATLAIASATPEINRLVVADARSRGVLVSSASEPQAGQFTVPAVWRSGPVTITVSTGGASPALARVLRDRAAAAIGPEPAALATLLIDLRAEFLARINDPVARRSALQAVADPAWLDEIRANGVEATRAALRRVLGLD